jgi:hypothetical protein
MDLPDKNEMLAHWHRMLNNHEMWKNQSSQYSCLMSSADHMLRTGAIDPFERFELVELLTGAYCHFMEEFPQEWMHPASEYSVYNQAGAFVGYIQGNRYFLGTPEKNFGPSLFFAQFSRDDPDRKIITATKSQYGFIRGRYIYTGTGQKLAMVEKNRWDKGVLQTRLDDPDIYRTLLDASSLALEDGGLPKFVALREKELFSIFGPCPDCCDRFDLREDCARCDGLGFIEDPDCPSKLPPGFVQPVTEPEQET